MQFDAVMAPLGLTQATHCLSYVSDINEDEIQFVVYLCTINIHNTHKPLNRAKIYADLSNTKTSQIISLYIFSVLCCFIRLGNHSNYKNHFKKSQFCYCPFLFRFNICFS